MRNYLWILWLCLGIGRLSAQKEASTEELLQTLVQEAEEQTDYTQLYEFYIHLLQHPLALNSADEEDLRGLQLLSEQQIRGFLLHRAKYGKLLSIYELQAIPHWDRASIDRLLPVVKLGGGVGEGASLRKAFLAEGNQQVLLRNGLDPNFNLPDSLRNSMPRSNWFMRFRSHYTQLYSIGFTMAQDVMEPWRKPNAQTPQPDFLSYHAVVYKQGKLNALALGDYQIQLGQGLLSAGGFQMGKGSESVAGVRRAHSGIRPYTSGNEQGYMRGMAASYQLLPKVEMTAWLSRQKADAKLDTLVEGNAQITSLPITGLHRSSSELSSEKNSLLQMQGINLLYRSNGQKATLGFTAMHWQYEHTLALDTNAFYRRFRPQGKQWLNLGFHYSWQWRNWHFFGETALHQGQELASLLGVVGSIGRPLQLALLYRNYGKGFYSPYGKGFAESSTTQNEEGFYIGLTYTPNRRWKLQAYVDQFRFPWLRYRADAPSSGHEESVRLTYKPSRKAYLYGQYRIENKAWNLSLNDVPIDGVTPRWRKQLQFHAYWGVLPKLSVQMRYQRSEVWQEGTTQGQWGMAMHQELTFNHAPFKISYRTMYFDTQNYDTRQYVYEKDVLYAYAFPAFYGRGIRHYLLFKVRLMRGLDAWFKYSWTTRYGESNVEQSIKWQLQWKF